MSTGSFTFKADPNDPTRCSEECPRWSDGIFGQSHCAITGNLMFRQRSEGCLAAEKHEAGRAARWVLRRAGGSECSACAHEIFEFEPQYWPKTCTGCGKRMVSDEPNPEPPKYTGWTCSKCGRKEWREVESFGKAHKECRNAFCSGRMVRDG